MIKAMDLWLGDCLSRRPAQPPAGVVEDIFIAVCDHFEPLHQTGGDQRAALAKLRRWQEEYPRLQAFAQSEGLPCPQHSFFFPIEQYQPEVGRALADLVAAGAGEVEVHLHHRDDTAETVREQLRRGVDLLVGHGLLSRDPLDGRPRYGFIHGNWALANSHPQGRHCGVNRELTVLHETGCYADFTLPSAPDRCQTRWCNRIYYAYDTGRPKPHDTGIEAQAGQPPPPPGPGGEPPLLLVQGPLGLNWQKRKKGVLPSLENGDLLASNPPSLARFRHWRRLRVQVAGWPQWTFVKLHTHGCHPANLEMWLGGPYRRFLADLAALMSKQPGFRLHFVTARQLVNLVHASENGYGANPYVAAQSGLPPPPIATRP